MTKETLLEKARKHTLQGLLEFLNEASKKGGDTQLLSWYRKLKDIAGKKETRSLQATRMVLLLVMCDMTLHSDEYINEGGDTALFFMWLYVGYEKALIEGV